MSRSVPLGLPAPLELIVSEAHLRAVQGRARADVVLFEYGIGASRSQLAQWFAAECVRVDGEVVSASKKLRVGQRVVVVVPPEPPTDALPEAIPIEILYQDEDLVVVNKAAGMVVHPAPGHASGTLVNALLHAVGTLASGVDSDADEADVASYLRPGIVHRLDKDTSGVMVVARTNAAKIAMQAMFATHDLRREYVGIAQGQLAAMTIDTLHGRDPNDRKKFSSKVSAGKRAVTLVRVEQQARLATRVRCTLETGRTHQIRVHLADRGHPLLGDPTYGRTNPELSAIAGRLGRQALHAEVLEFKHPTQGRLLTFRTPPPKDFERAWHEVVALGY